MAVRNTSVLEGGDHCLEVVAGYGLQTLRFAHLIRVQ